MNETKKEDIFCCVIINRFSGQFDLPEILVTLRLGVKRASRPSDNFLKLLSVSLKKGQIILEHKYAKRMTLFYEKKSTKWHHSLKYKRLQIFQKNERQPKKRSNYHFKMAATKCNVGND